MVAHSGPYPLTFATLLANGHEAAAQVEGRDQAAAPVDQPKLTQGSWVRPGEVVLERSFADELGVGAGGQVTLNGRSFRVAGVAVTAASYLSDPQVCSSSCGLTVSELASGPGLDDPGRRGEPGHRRGAAVLHAEPEAGRPGRR